MKESDEQFDKVLEAASERTNQALSFCPVTVQEIFSESLHDSTIERIEREQNTLHLYVNTDGGFSSKALIHFSFNGVISEETDEPLQLGQWFIYDELQKTDHGFAFRVLFECPESQWTIEVKDLDARYFYHPAEYTRLRDEEKLDYMSMTEYTARLNPDYLYWFITPDVECVIQSISGNMLIENGSIDFQENEMIVTVGREHYSYHLNEYNPISFIYTNVYEDPYEHLNEPVPSEDLVKAALSNDLELQVRAWNTMYANPHELVESINQVLSKLELKEENELMLSVYAGHFHKEGILNETIIKKYRNILD